MSHLDEHLNRCIGDKRVTHVVRHSPGSFELVLESGDCLRVTAVDSVLYTAAYPAMGNPGYRDELIERAA